MLQVFWYVHLDADAIYGTIDMPWAKLVGQIARPSVVTARLPSQRSSADMSSAGVEGSLSMPSRNEFITICNKIKTIRPAVQRRP